MAASRLFFVTGKGGVGKTTVVAALGTSVAERGGRALLVELAADRGIAHFFGGRKLGAEPQRLAPNLDAVRLESRALLEAYFSRLLRLPMLTQRLLSSITFNAVATAAPGVGEFLVLEHVMRWLEPGLLRRRSYDAVVFDGPATGHALALLRTPAKLRRMVSGGPIGTTSRRLLELLGDHDRAAVVLVSIADDMAVNEAAEAHAAVAGDLAMRVTAPVLNLAAARRFTKGEQQTIARLMAKSRNDPLLVAADLQIRARRETERHLARLRAAFRLAPVALPEVDDGRPGPEHLHDLGARLERILDESRP